MRNTKALAKYIQRTYEDQEIDDIALMYTKLYLEYGNDYGEMADRLLEHNAIEGEH